MVVHLEETRPDGPIVAHTLDRRKFIRVVAIAGASLPLLSIVEDARASIDLGLDAAAGIVVETTSGRFTLRTPDADLTVVPLPGAQMYSGAFGEVNDTTHLVVGDRIAVQGTKTDSLFEAAFAGSVFSTLDAEVQSISGDRSIAQTTIGAVELKDGRLPFASAEVEDDLRGDPVRAGDHISGLGWRDPRTGETYLLIRAE